MYALEDSLGVVRLYQSTVFVAAIIFRKKVKLKILILARYANHNPTPGVDNQAPQIICNPFSNKIHVSTHFPYVDEKKSHNMKFH